MQQNLKERIKKVLDSDNVISNDSIISAYDLIQVIDFVLGDVFRLLEKEEFINRINKLYVMTEENKLKKNDFYVPWLNNLLGNPQVLYLFSWISETSLLYLKFILRIQNHTITFSISKPINSDELSYEWMSIRRIKDKEIVRKFVNDNFEIINEMFLIMEEFYNNFGLRIKNSRIDSNDSIQIVSDGFLKLTINLNKGFLNYDLSLDSCLNLNCYNELLSDRDLRSEFKLNKELIIKKIAVNIEELNEFYKQIISNYNIKDKVKVLKNRKKDLCIKN